ncbi:MAG: START domain-containing protein [Pseudomonadota bacterium]
MMRMLPLLFVLLLPWAAAAKTAEPGWDFAGEGDGIKVWTKTIPGAPLKDFRGVMQVDLPLAVVVAAVTDIAAMPEWFFRMSESRIVDSQSLADAHVYFVLQGIWPVSDRDAVIKAGVAQDPQTLVLSMMADAAPAKLPAVEGRVRIPRMHSGWKLTPLSPTRTEIELIGNADPGGMIPLWLANAVVVLMPKETLKRLRKQMTLPKYRDPEAIFARDPLLRELRSRIRMPGEEKP